MQAAAARSELELQMTEALVDCAYALATAFGEAAKTEGDVEQRFRLYDAFHRSFQAVRLGIRLSMTLRAPAHPTAANAEADPVERVETEHERTEVRAERERGDREREGDYEPVSLAKFLATLRGVASAAERLPLDADPDVLPRLKHLLAEAHSAPANDAGVTVKVRPPPPSPQRSALLGSTVRRFDFGVGPRLHPPPRPSG